MSAVFTTILCSQVDSWQAPWNSFKPRNALTYADCTTSRASSSFRVNRRATARRRPPNRRTIVSNAHSCPARSAASRAFSSTTSPCVERMPSRACMAPPSNRTEFEAVWASPVHIGHLFELFCDKQGAARDTDQAGRQFANQCDAVCVDEGDAGKIEHEPVAAVPVLTKNVLARSAQLLDPRPSHLAFEPQEHGLVGCRRRRGGGDLQHVSIGASRWSNRHTRIAPKRRQSRICREERGLRSFSEIERTWLLRNVVVAGPPPAWAATGSYDMSWRRGDSGLESNGYEEARDAGTMPSLFIRLRSVFG